MIASSGVMIWVMNDRTTLRRRRRKVVYAELAVMPTLLERVRTLGCWWH